jgi:hypothetical protein
MLIAFLPACRWRRYLHRNNGGSPVDIGAETGWMS